MLRFQTAAAVVVAAAATWPSLAAADDPPFWAYGFAGPPPLGTPATGSVAPPPDDPAPLSVPGSTATFTRAQLRDLFDVADWHPGDHPPMPEVVAKGRRPDVRACAYCHYPNGKGRPENAGISGLPPAYFAQQIEDFRNGSRMSADTRKGNTKLMVAIAQGMTAEEVRAAAEYFASMPWSPWIRVVEAADVPRTRIAGGMFIPLDGPEREPIGDRIIEVPEAPARTDLRDPRASFVAYVPPGSIARGEALAGGGNGTTVACGVCHGADLKGMGPVPGIAGRSPSYLVRQMYDMQAGTRKGLWTDLMKPVVQRLTNDDMLAIAAYAASRTP
ncbi:MAG: c-type cytochrome [Acidimicrobiia bacterium]|nr:c-type cytochrome [Acidimicrobiia bacterium]